MDTSVIRQKLHSYLEIADDKKVKALYAIMETEIDEKDLDYSDEFKAGLDKRYDDLISGKAKTISAEESKRRIQVLLKSKKK